MILFEGVIDGTDLQESIPTELKKTLFGWQQNGRLRLRTSGSTGDPKLIELSGDLVKWSAEASTTALNLSKKEKVLVCLPTNKIGGMMLVMRSVINQWHVTITEPVANPMSEVSEKHDFSFVSLVPYQLATILGDEKSTEKLLRFKTVLLGGAPLSTVLENSIKQLFKKSSLNIYHSYGMTETASHVALRDLSVMQPNTFSLLEHVDASLDEFGCLKFVFNTLDYTVQTKDLGLVEGRNIRFLSRSDDVVNSGGVKLHMHDIKMKIDNITEDNGCAVRYFLWKEDDDALGEKLVFVGLQNRQQDKIETLVIRYLPKYEVPRKFYWTEAFKRNESGKIDKPKTLKDLIEISG